MFLLFRATLWATGINDTWQKQKHLLMWRKASAPELFTEIQVPWMWQWSSNDVFLNTAPLAESIQTFTPMFLPQSLEFNSVLILLSEAQQTTETLC